MEKRIKYIIREVPPEQTEFSFYFDNDGLKEIGGDYCYNLFIVAQSRNSSGFNEKEYASLQTEIENLLEMYADIVNKSNYARYSSIGAMLFDYKLIGNMHNTKRIAAYTDFFKKCFKKPRSPYANYSDNFTAHNEEMTAEYLTLKTGKEWATDSAYGYCQGDYVKMVYCPEHYKDGVKQYGEIWLGAAKEFGVHKLGDDGEETDSCYGYIVADCQVNYATQDADYKRIVSEWSDITQEDDVALEMVEGSHTVTHYTYRTA